MKAVQSLGAAPELQNDGESALVRYARLRPRLSSVERRDGDAWIVLIEQLRQQGERVFQMLANELARISAYQLPYHSHADASAITAETSQLIAVVRTRPNRSHDERFLTDHVLRTTEWLMQSTAQASVQLAANLVLLKRAQGLNHARQ